MTTLAIIPARGRSKGLPNKNLAIIGGISLVAHAVRAAKSVHRIDQIIVSSDSEKILEEGAAYGADPERRPAELATDTAITEDVIRFSLSSRPDVSTVVLLQPTSPLRRPSDIDRCLDAFSGEAPVATVSEVEHPIEWTYRLTTDQTLSPIEGWEAIPKRRQDALKAYRTNGAVYVASAAFLQSGEALVNPATRAVTMPGRRSIDIDDALSLEVARVLYRRSRTDA